MADVVSKKKRSEMMSGIRGKNTLPELIIRSALHKRGYRYRLHAKDMPGKPDIVFPKYKAVIQINGCFWHGHDCHLFKMPSTRKEFWSKKINSNKENDRRSLNLLKESGWRILIIWECGLKGKHRLPLDGILLSIENFLHGSTRFEALLCKEK